MPRTKQTTNQQEDPDVSASSMLIRLDERLANLLEQVAEFRREYKEQTNDIKQRQDEQFGQMKEKQDEQFATVMTRITDIETWKATEIQATRIMRWDQAARTVDDYLDDGHVKRRERVFKAVEKHLNDKDELDGLTWLSRTRDRWGFMLTLVGTFLGIISGLFYWLLTNVIVPWFRGGQ